MFVSVWTCEDLATQKDFITTNMKNKSRMTAVMSSAGFHSKTGVLEMLVSLHMGYTTRAYLCPKQLGVLRLPLDGDYSTQEGWRGTPYSGLYGEAPPERSIFFRLRVYKRVGISQVEA